jgi:hypothetical protein
MGQIIRMGHVIVGADEFINVIISWNCDHTLYVWDVEDFDTYNERYHCHIYGRIDLRDARGWAEDQINHMTDMICV